MKNLEQIQVVSDSGMLSPASANPIVKIGRVRDELGGVARSTIYKAIDDLEFPKPIKLFNGRAVGWPAGEVETIKRAMIAGFSKEQMRELVAELEAARTTAWKVEDVRALIDQLATRAV